MSAVLKSNAISDAERAIRVDLAAAYRLVALYGWDDIIFTHISARVPGPEHHFLINPYGLLFEEITASSLVKIDVEGNKLVESPFYATGGGQVADHGVVECEHGDCAARVIASNSKSTSSTVPATARPPSTPRSVRVTMGRPSSL